MYHHPSGATLSRVRMTCGNWHVVCASVECAVLVCRVLGGYVGAPYEGTCLRIPAGMAPREGTKAPGIPPCPFGSRTRVSLVGRRGAPA
eukprot:7356050-Prymnesium_polylepis.1